MRLIQDQATELIEVCWKRDNKLAVCSFDSLSKQIWIERFNGGTLRIFVTIALIRKMIEHVSAHDMEVLSILLRYPRSKLNDKRNLPQSLALKSYKILELLIIVSY